MGRKKLERKTIYVVLRQQIYPLQKETKVWIDALDDGKTKGIFSNISDLWAAIDSVAVDRTRIIIPEIKRDGAPILFFLLTEGGYLNGFDITNNDFFDDSKLLPKSVKYTILKGGQWISITAKNARGNLIKIVGFDALAGKKIEDFAKKTMPETVFDDGISDDRRYTDFITEREKKDITNRLKILKECYQKVANETGDDCITAGGAALKDYKMTLPREYFNTLFPNLFKKEIREDDFGAKNAEEYLRKAYKGGWIFVNPEVKEKQIKDTEISVYDVNSMYAAQMAAESSNVFPFGEPMFVKADRLPDYLKNTRDFYYFIRFRCSFFVRPGHFPFVSVPNNFYYSGRRNLETSDIYFSGKYFQNYKNSNGKKRKATVELTMTQTEFKIFRKNYIILDFEILDFCVFHALPAAAIFESFVEHWRLKKTYGNASEKEVAKVLLTRLYGKFGTNDESEIFNLHFTKSEPIFDNLIKTKKTGGYVAIAAAITSYAKEKLITVAQKNKETFIFANTDSIHIFGSSADGIRFSPREFGNWKKESTYNDAIYFSEGCYIAKNENDIKIATGLFTDFQKEVIKKAIKREAPKEYYSPEEKEFVQKGLNFFDFSPDMFVPGEKIMTCLKGGCVPLAPLAMDAPVYVYKKKKKEKDDFSKWTENRLFEL